MGIHIDRARAEDVLRAEADADARSVASPVAWVALITQFSEACEAANAKTHIAFLGTAILARATDLGASAYAVKYKDDSEGAYSARTLGHKVLVRLAPRLGIDVGVSGPEPLNNQPYFRIDRADLESLLKTVRGRAVTAVRELVAMLDRLAAIQTEAEARAALRAYIHVRRQYQRLYAPPPPSRSELSFGTFLQLVAQLLADDSEGGKRAQAVVAGLLDVVVRPNEAVIVSKVNDPDRHFPGDVGMRRVDAPSNGATQTWTRVFEVRDKPVHESDVDLFVRKCVKHGVARAVVVAAGEAQPNLDVDDLATFAHGAGVFLTVHIGWDGLLREVLVWSETTPVVSLRRAHERVRQRLQELEVRPSALELWDGVPS